jgi:PPOX class probable F420-dependent enzyme
MEISDGVKALEANNQSVLVTLKRDGKPQLSNVLHAVEDGRAKISITSSRAKYHNLVRTPWAALHVNGANFWSYAVVECSAELSPVVTDPHDATADAMVEHYKLVAAKEHSDWEEYRASLVSEGRLLLTLTPTHAYGMIPR